ncbi:ABC transporter ATP-binding protein [Paenibacillus thermoaerophilus]|uniref:ABC transporter ATP-binding protein n=1 Tax=Paenibacillus thermoaerophilus TaxID=1215385 RepID=A0ABW2V883_9BACL|nr:ABC transporter ATP-binding protein [Paenibacillus thermoaerophilus]TMV17106.1 ABC transporter ATP-binding protein [Paenibacillus thermoaerophilus]
MEAAVELEKVSQVFVNGSEARLAVEQISLQVRPGEFVSLVGPSGCGKTTILSIAAGLLRPTQGTARVFGEAVDRPSERVGYMLQQDYLFPWRTIIENATLGLELRGRLNAETKQYALHLLEEMGLADVARSYPSQLSGGMRQRVALVRTLATEPDILLLDEPFSALDYRTKLQLEDLVWDTLKHRGKTALLVTHDISEAIAMSDRVLVLNRNPGRLRRELAIPQRLRADSPFYAREQPGFQELFQDIWQEFESMER